MRGLLYKNFLLYRVDLIVIGCIQFIASATAILMSAAGIYNSEDIMLFSMTLYFCVFITSVLFEQQIFEPDEKRVVSSFIISAPGGTKGHIQSKYYTILIINLLILFCCFITDCIVCGVLKATDHSIGMLCVLFFCINLIFSAFSTPFYIRFGSVYGNYVKFGVLGVIILIAGIYGLFGDISFLLGDNPLAAIMEFLSRGNTLLVLSLFLAATVLIYYVSYWISLKLYRKGAESYEQ